MLALTIWFEPSTKGYAVAIDGLANSANVSMITWETFCLDMPCGSWKQLPTDMTTGYLPVKSVLATIAHHGESKSV